MHLPIRKLQLESHCSRLLSIRRTRPLGLRRWKAPLAFGSSLEKAESGLGLAERRVPKWSRGCASLHGHKTRWCLICLCQQKDQPRIPTILAFFPQALGTTSHATHTDCHLYPQPQCPDRRSTTTQPIPRMADRQGLARPPLCSSSR